MIDPSADVYTRLTHPGLRDAAEILVRELHDGDGRNPVDILDVYRWLGTLLLALEEERGIAGAAELSVIEVAGMLRLLERLRGLVIDRWSGEGELSDPSAALRLLAAMERVRRDLDERASGDSFSSLLAALRGPEILVQLAHDLRSPLTSILFLSDALRRGQSGELNGLQNQQLAIIYGAALNLSSMAGDVIELARGGKQLTDTRPSPFSIGSLLESVCDVVRPVAERKGLELRLAATSNGKRVGFPVALSRVMLNLATNALTATERGFVEIAAVEGPSDGVRFSVRDSGPGIDAAEIENLFEPFRSGRSDERFAFSGSGLGLAISRKLVAAMDGDLRFDSQPNRGACFFFHLSLPRAARD